jgi:F-type H+-transporting ATPase subunit a
VLGCNLCGLLPWVGSPTGSFGVTTALAAVTFSAGTLSGMKKFGVAGFFANQVPQMSLPLVMSIFIKPMLLVLELIGLVIKHTVLAIRLLANMVAGHLVLLGIMGLAFGASAAANFVELPTWLWAGTAVVAILSSALFSCLELFVAFLQAYIFTFLSALFIGAAVHHH